MAIGKTLWIASWQCQHHASSLPPSEISLCNRFGTTVAHIGELNVDEADGVRGKRFVANNWIFQMAERLATPHHAHLRLLWTRYGYRFMWNFAFGN